MRRIDFIWEKMGNIFTPSQPGNPSWIEEYAQAPNTIEIDGKTIMYFCSRRKPNLEGQYESRIGYLELDFSTEIEIRDISTDPILPLGNLGSFDEFGTYPFSPVIKDNYIFAAYGGWTRCDSTPFDVSIGLAHSDLDSRRFVKIGNGPVLSKSLKEPFVISSPKLRYYNERFYLFYIAGKEWIRSDVHVDPIYTIRMATSQDCVNWKREDREIIETKIDNQEAQASPDVFFHKGYYHMFFCYRHGANFRNHARGYRMGYAYSDDLVNWTRDDSKSKLEPSISGWDSESVSYPHVFTAKNEIYMAYLGNGIGKSGIGLARLVSYED